MAYKPMRCTPELAGIECLAAGRTRCRNWLRRQIDVAVARTHQRSGKARPVVHRVPHPLHAELVVADLAEDVAVPNRNEMIGLVDPRLPVRVSMRFSETRLSSSNLPSFTLNQGDEHCPGGRSRSQSGMRRSIGRGKQVKRNVLLQRPGGVKVESGEVEPGG